jgi:hypothetical protein
MRNDRLSNGRSGVLVDKPFPAEQNVTSPIDKDDGWHVLQSQLRQVKRHGLRWRQPDSLDQRLLIDMSSIRREENEARLSSAKVCSQCGEGGSATPTRTARA